jgi:hypothetical protein
MKKLPMSVSISFLLFAASVFAADTVPPGQYMELFSGSKMGGTAYHGELITLLKKDTFLDGFKFFCIKGRDRSADSSSPAYSIDREQRLPPELAKTCKGSAAILLGPVQGENLEAPRKHFDDNYMHLYSSLRTVR